MLALSLLNGFLKNDFSQNRLNHKERLSTKIFLFSIASTQLIPTLNPQLNDSH